ncbi:hypothetical protein [Streptomyces cavernae]|uniref:hypothetical protein n=1 Tax=Streptomyces cavernae TaxID=2259034 RepID=UPI000FEC1B02|nr:hypothetical protein [Streptomyces cavernae]
MFNVTGMLKRLVIGRAMRSEELHETLLPKRLALPIFASDPLSSVAYATQRRAPGTGRASGASPGFPALMTSPLLSGTPPAGAPVEHFEHHGREQRFDLGHAGRNPGKHRRGLSLK